MFAVPWAIPVTIPAAFTVAVAEALLLHAPPLAASANVVTDPAHTLAIPVMVPALGNGLIVTTVVAFATPQQLVTV